MRLIPLALAMLAAACSAATAPTVTSLPPVLTSSPATPDTVATTTTTDGGGCFPDGPGQSDFVAEGVVGTAGGPGGDARVVAAVTIDSARAAPGQDGACERLAIDLATADGAPATSVGIVGIELLVPPAVLRLTLPPTVTATAIADIRLEGGLVERAFVVRTGDGLFVDVHLAAAVAAAPVAARGRVVVDLQRIGDLPAGAAVSGVTGALVSPAGTQSGYPLRISGYGRDPSGELTVALVGATNDIEETVAVADYPWSFFELIVADGPLGPVEVTAGDAAAQLLIGP